MEKAEQLAEGFSLLAERVNWIVQLLPHDIGTEDDLRKVSLRKVLHLVEASVKELRDAVSRVQGMEAVLSEEQADIAKRNDAEDSATAKLAEAERQFALASDKMREYETLKIKLEDSQSQVKINMDAWISKLEALKQQESEIAQKEASASAAAIRLDARETAVRMAEEKSKSLKTEVEELGKRKATLQKEGGDIVDDLSKFRQTWRRLQKQDKTLEEKIKTYNERTSALDEWQRKQEQELDDEKARVGRRNDTIRRLEATVQATGIELRAHEEASTSLRTEYEAAVEALDDKTIVVGDLELQVETESKRADELQRQLNEANGKIKALERALDEKEEGKYEEMLQRVDSLKDSNSNTVKDLLRKIDGLKISNMETVDGLVTSNRDTVKCSVDAMEQLKQAMVVATGALNNGTEAIGRFRGQWSPKVRQVESSAKQLGATTKDLQLLEQKWSAKLRDQKSLAEGRKADLIHAFSQELKEEHTAKLASLSKSHEVERQADRAALSKARSEVDQLRNQLSEKVEVHTSPERRHKRVKADSNGDGVPKTLPTQASGDRSQGEVSMWQAALNRADEVWRSFEPVILTHGISYSWIIMHLAFVVESEGHTGRFQEFLNSDAEGWYCVTAVVLLGYKDGKSKRDGRCAYSERHNRKMCTGIRKVSNTRKLEIKLFEH
ncbi:hypothetical protein VMCG_10233 [Cytospora schulzeri]|uniref:Uncharacterized protein n=1 Tax=Cytospora schulzeri TaxID=448051 RepID=A0A423VEW2_9PEZI|nr:hypothetical protein VMCG_10233 [Valsa malicola]